jgi:hypothetical protein
MSLWRWKKDEKDPRTFVTVSSVIFLLIGIFIVVRTALVFFYWSHHPDLIPRGP